MFFGTKSIFSGLRRLTFLGLLICFGYQTIDSYEKYLNKRTTIAFRSDLLVQQQQML